MPWAVRTDRAPLPDCSPLGGASLPGKSGVTRAPSTGCPFSSTTVPASDWPVASKIFKSFVGPVSVLI